MERTISRVSPAVVVNAGAYTAVDKAEDEAEAALVHAVNVEGPRSVAAICARLGIPVVHISTDYVFDGSKTEPYLEDDSTGPLNAYGRSKLEGERAVMASGGAHIILRTSWVYSPFGHNFVKTMLRLAETKPELGVVDDQVGNPTFAPHLAEAILTIARRLASEPEPSSLAGIYNAAGRGDTTWFGFAEEIFRCSGLLGGASRECARHCDGRLQDTGETADDLPTRLLQAGASVRDRSSTLGRRSARLCCAVGEAGSRCG
jgi:dTDP-4-dehydrorhamnose reductase